MPARTLLAALLAALCLALAACGSEDDNGAAAAAAPQETATQPEAAAPAEATKPTVKLPTGKAPTKLETKDLKVGTGAAAKAGDTVTVQYVGVLRDGGKQFDASWDRGQPFSFPLGAGQVIAGWDQGVEGMKVGGRRLLDIPSALAYGEASPSPDIPPNSDLVFVVDLLQVQ
jgi:peptidylprolyl isomerase